MSILLAASLFFTNPAPMEMPRAQAFLVKERAERKARQTMRLEDRFDRTDLWISRSVDGMWRDADGREFMLATLGTIAPPLTGDKSVTREDYVASPEFATLIWRKGVSSQWRRGFGARRLHNNLVTTFQNGLAVAFSSRISPRV